MIPKGKELGVVLLIAFIISILIETLSRKSIFNVFTFIVSNPLIFFLNMCIILFTLSLSFLFTRRKFVLVMISTVWMGLGIANGIILLFRLTPLSAMDFYDISNVAMNLPEYLTLRNILLFVGIFIVIIGLMTLLWKKLKKDKLPIGKGISYLVGTGLLLIFLLSITFKMNLLSDHFDNLHDAYKEYGFAYCLTNSIINRGIKKPKDYSKNTIDEIKESLINKSSVIYKGEGLNQDIEKPNIIMVQLESFFDVNLLKNYTFSKNPTPNFTKLKEEFTSGYLKVPVYGAGTVNTEFEIITGMSSRFFGTGEYPYRTILATTTAESICYNLSNLGYHNYVIHNNTATFYKRNEVFKNLGFDNFVSMEYMNGIEENPIGWAKDRVLTSEVMKALNADDSRDFIYTITVQDHGIYPDTTNGEEKIKVNVKPDSVEKIPDSKSNERFVNQLTYYVNQIYETDMFIEELIRELTEFREPTVVVFYGDHLPPLSFQNEDLKSDRYETEYVMWSNFPMEKERHDLTAYQLNAYVLARLDIEEGILTKFHQVNINEADYHDKLKMLQYDMLYGKKHIYGGKNPYEKKDLKMGIYDQTIKNIEEKDEVILIVGENFTPSSRVCINDQIEKTIFVNENTLQIKKQDLTSKAVSIVQVTDGNVVLSESISMK